jgi:hypothetical protein
MKAFDHAHVVQRQVESVLLDLLQSPAVVAGQSKGLHPVAVGPIDRLQHVRAVARPADGDQGIAGRGQIHQLLDEDLVVGQVVADRHDPTGVVGQAEYPQPLLALVQQIRFAQRALAQIFADMAGRQPRSAVADQEHEPLLLPRFVDQVGPAIQRRPVDPPNLVAQPLQITA